ncbi:hypothetical protein [Arsukibacterium sp.]|uniref:hypothetical protein n=1 Tax=Arsukibacterium sp. TaxID=1977258 RepID=UPI00299E8C8B|nr:hypothetical protein [Arsukibacterium sp.]MDX1678532.1 hypothetical protein [Arsukibacterium sp.]
MLSTLVQQQKHWTIPLMVSLMLSWCLMLCNGLVSNAYAAADASLSVATATATPPCHGTPGLSKVAADDSSILQSTDNYCAGCDSQATQLDPLSLPAVVLSVSWLQVADNWPRVIRVVDSFALTPPPRPAVPLYLRKSLLLI